MAIATFPSDSNQVKDSVDRRKVGTKKRACLVRGVSPISGNCVLTISSPPRP